MIEALTLQPWDTMSLLEADLWFGVCSVSMGAISHTFTHPNSTNPLSPLHEPLRGRATRDPKAKNAFSAVLSTEGRVVGLWWAKLKPQGPKGLHWRARYDPKTKMLGERNAIRKQKCFLWNPFYGTVCRWHTCWEKLKPKGPKGSFGALILQSWDDEPNQG